MSVRFRELKEKDIPKVISMFSNLSKERAEVSFVEIASMEEIRDWIRNPDTFVYVAADGDLISAVLRAKRGKGNKQHSCNLTVAVDYSFRGNSIAKELTDYALESLKEKGIKIIRAYIYSNNKSSINTILSCGFTFAGNVHMHHYDEKTGTYIDDLIFHKLL
ncbi:GNAT family N-acetyltransferase [Paramaledivibacter caminithermalis]|jgi:L-amino acid N-acyltransferase YncA|uniref:L-amino acid N-acyltransferase YncA n=1 Tax=Paramaledivibacter caminithermalis (strain DSM 15212 / CIP 107654 / DViRD3) TaxID=1121301 RepID=A0A1M6SYY9_PARC5|nr:GNAT family N-acetyltransferase [Paramaledivibacter caminithermalis]SHK49925.1 L-amino acid N-acyltransferase YncA [Paramaledivibacter caminithermalis DSM 15212]